VPDDKTPPEVREVLRDLAARGLLQGEAASAAPPISDEQPDLDEALAGGEPVFVSSCGLRNLTILNHLYGAALGDLAMEVTRAVAIAVVAQHDPAAQVLAPHGPDLVVLHGPVSQGQVEAMTARLCAVVGSVTLPAGPGVVALRPVVATLELRQPASWSADDVVRTLQEVRSEALGSDLGRAMRVGE
jgi:hypothetical protein